MSQPIGFEKEGREDKVYKLDKALYGSNKLQELEIRRYMIF